jgi:nucleotide-binding universal stress UspA family protein
MKRILIVIDGSENDAESLSTAATISAITQAQLTVAYPTEQAHNFASVGEFAFASSIAPAGGDAQVQAQAAFEKICGDLPSATFKIYDAGADAIITALGHAHDVIIVERVSDAEGPEAGNLNCALFNTGRPVLVAPGMAITEPFASPVIAWNGSVQTSRALHGALPWLAAIGEATVLVGTSAGEMSCEPMRDYLGCHGVRSRVVEYDSDRMTARARGRALISAASDVSGDLLITGGFGEANFDMISGLGRATQKIVTGAPIPVLLQS